MLLFNFRLDKDNKSNDNKNSPSKFTNDLTSIFNSINSISKHLSNNIPQLKSELYTQLFRLSAQRHRTDLISRLANQCIQENLQLSGSMNEIDVLTNYTLSHDVVEQLARYKRGEMSWKEKLSMIDFDEKANLSKLEEIYQEAKQDGQYSFHLQEQLLDKYLQEKSIRHAFDLVHDMASNRYQV